MLHSYQQLRGGTGPLFTFLSGGDCYALRCAYLHQGEFGVLDQRARKALDEFRFTVPGDGLVHNNRTDGALQLQVDIFCEQLCVAVEAWLASVAGIR
jgi:hypothetical protein